MASSRLLILDDDQALAQQLSQAATLQGYEVRTIPAATQLMDAVRTWQPTHLAIDWLMPDLDGLAVLETLSQLENAPAIILTSGVGSATLPAAQLAALEHQLNIRGILHQPFHPQIIRHLLAGQTSIDQHAHLPDEDARPVFSLDAATLETAIREQQFEVYYQPKIELMSGKVMGFEGLLRWRHPQAGIQLPERFIPLAEKTGLINPLTAWVIDQGLGFIQSLGLISNQDLPLTFSLNISATSIHHEALTDHLLQACKTHDIAPSRVILELTETATLHDPAQAQQVLNRWRALGFKLSIDDFGTGYSSMAQLAQLPFTELKIDKSFVTTMESSQKSRKVIASTLKLAESLGLETIAEGVENTLAAIGLRELGCRYAQGYYFSRPMDAAAARSWLSHWDHQF